MKQAVLTECKLPIKIWSTAKVDRGGSQHASEPGWDAVYQQFKNLANHPLARKWICAMPDYHLGYGMPIGGVLATTGGVVPNAVGVDIGCGMIAVRTSLDADALSDDVLQALRLAIHERVPVGPKHHEKARELPLGLRMDVIHDESIRVVPGQLERVALQLGTLGGGNHFIELQKDEGGRLWIMLHSGSRNVGKQVCDHYHKIAKRYMQDFASAVPDLDLAFLPESVPEYKQYLAEMRWCMAFAEANRQAMLDAVYAAFKERGLLFEVDLGVDTHHNFAAMEHHYGKNLLVHRKGAVRAEGLVTIPGSMGTASYICEGLKPAESFNTCAHGAGRRMGRKEANRTITHEQAVEQMKGVVYGVREGDYDEMPAAYKDVDQVIAAQDDLARPVHRLTPLTVVKG